MENVSSNKEIGGHGSIPSASGYEYEPGNSSSSSIKSGESQGELKKLSLLMKATVLCSWLSVDEYSLVNKVTTFYAVVHAGRGNSSFRQSVQTRGLKHMGCTRFDNTLVRPSQQPCIHYTMRPGATYFLKRYLIMTPNTNTK
jgi:hypothetical protein